MLHHRPSRLPRTLILAAIALGTLQAQETGLFKDVKVRLGYGLATKDNLNASALGVGLMLGYATPAATWGLEVGYNYKGGDQFMAAPNGTPKEGLAALDPARFGDSRRNTLDGLAIRLSFQQALNEQWNWQAGLMLGGTRFKHEYVGQASSVGWSSAAGAGDSWLDTWNGTPSKGGLTVSPYAGVTWKMGSVSSIELNVLLLNYQALSYTHVAGNGSYAVSTVPGADSGVGQVSENNAFPLDSLASTRRLVPHVEFAYVFHF